jgi:hypothetical protein
MFKAIFCMVWCKNELGVVSEALRLHYGSFSLAILSMNFFKLSFSLLENYHLPVTRPRTKPFDIKHEYGNHSPIYKKTTPWFWSASELCRPSDHRLLAK